jgi:Fe-S-cluster containining protein
MMECRTGCGACCIAPSITSPLPGMPNGKPAGSACAQLSSDYACNAFGSKERPSFCSGLQPSVEMCGISRQESLAYLTQLELATAPQV